MACTWTFAYLNTFPSTLDSSFFHWFSVCILTVYGNNAECDLQYLLCSLCSDDWKALCLCCDACFLLSGTLFLCVFLFLEGHAYWNYPMMCFECQDSHTWFAVHWTFLENRIVFPFLWVLSLASPWQSQGILRLCKRGRCIALPRESVTIPAGLCVTVPVVVLRASSVSNHETSLDLLLWWPFIFWFFTLSTTWGFPS